MSITKGQTNSPLRRIILVTSLILIQTGVGNGVKFFDKEDSDRYYYPIDKSDDSDLNSRRCSDYKGHLSGKSRWPYSCLLPASHLATGRIFDGTSSLPERQLAPPWLNRTLFEEGQRFARANSGYLLLTSIYGLFCTNLFLDSHEVLLFVGGFDSPDGASRRNTRIANEIFNWYRDTPPSTEIPSFEDVARGIRNVRRAHRNVTTTAESFQWKKQRLSLITPSAFKSRSVNSDLWQDFMRDVAASPIPYENRRFPSEYFLTNDHRRPLNQFINAMTQFGFVGFPVLFPERVGLTNSTNEELFAFNHLWAVLAYCVGIRDEFNISLQPDLHTTRKYFQDIFETFIQPAFFQVDFFAKVLVDSVLEGVNLLDTTMTPRVVVTRILRDLLRIPVPNMTSRLSTVDRVTLAASDAVLGNNEKLNQKIVTLYGEDLLSRGDFYDRIVPDSLVSALNGTATKSTTAGPRFPNFGRSRTANPIFPNIFERTTAAPPRFRNFFDRTTAAPTFPNFFERTTAAPTFPTFFERTTAAPPRFRNFFERTTAGPRFPNFDRNGRVLKWDSDNNI